MAFQKATKTQARLRMALIGPSGSGKTWTALEVASALAPGGKVAVIDTERGSASLYSDRFPFDVCELDTFSPQSYVNAIRDAAAAGYEVLVIDSLSHAWSGKGGALEMVDTAAARSKSSNTYFAWRDVTPQHNMLVDAILQAPMHVIVTMRAKTEYIVETVNGKQVPKKIGMAPIQRDGVEYEFSIVGDLTLDHDLIITKTRCSALDGVVVRNPGADLAATLRAWLTDGATPPPPQPKPATTTTTTDPREAALAELRGVFKAARDRGIVYNLDGEKVKAMTLDQINNEIDKLRIALTPQAAA
jgi:hypothetical protein